MNILALDLGTDTGYTFNTGDDVIYGTWKLGHTKEIAEWGRRKLTRHRDPRIGRLFCRVQNTCEAADIQAVVFEDVQFSKFTYQTQLWASFRAAVWLATPLEVRIISVPVGTLKKFAAGAGNASKLDMSEALAKKFPDRFRFLSGKAVDRLSDESLTDDEADAILLHLWAQKFLPEV